MSTYTMTFVDESQEESGVTFHLPEITAVNFETFLGNTGLGDEQVLIDAVRAFSGGGLVRTTATIKTEVGEDPPVDDQLQRERKVLFRYRDARKNKLGSFEIPVYNLTAKIPGKDDIDMTAPEVLALQAALNVYVGFDDGAITLLSGKLVGRNI